MFALPPCAGHYQWAEVGNYFGYVRNRRKRVLRLTLPVAAVRAGVAVAVLKEHEDGAFWHQQDTVPNVARMLEVDKDALMALFVRARRREPSHLMARMVVAAERKGIELVFS